MSPGRLCAALVTAATSWTASADDWTVTESAVSAAVGNDDAVSSLLSRHKNDDLCAWVATEILLCRGQLGMAKSFVQGLEDRALAARLRRYLERRQQRPGEPAQLVRLHEARRLRSSNRPAAALRKLPSLIQEESVLCVLRARERGASMRDLGRPEDGDGEFLTAARIATRLGWWDGATAALRQTGICRAGSSNVTSETLVHVRRRLGEGEAMLIFTTLHADLVCVGVTRDRTVMLVVDACASLQSSLLRDGAFLGASRGAALDWESSERAGEALLAPLDALPAVSHVCVVPDWGVMGGVPLSAFAPGYSVSYHDPELLYRFRSSSRESGKGVLAVQPREASEVRPRGVNGRILASEKVDASEFTKLAGTQRWGSVHITAALEREQGRFVRPDGGQLFRVAELLPIDADLLVLSSSWSGLTLAPHQRRFKRLEWARVLAANGEEDAAVSYVKLLDSSAKALGRGIPTKALLLAPRVRGCIVHLWEKDHEASRMLFRKFYEVWFESRAGNSVVAAARALREAQKVIRSQPRWKDPYFWAGWQVWGGRD